MVVGHRHASLILHMDSNYCHGIACVTLNAVGCYYMKTQEMDIAQRS